MQLEVFTLSNYAVNHNGALTIQDSFDSIIVPTIPQVHPTCFLTVKFRTADSEAGKHDFQIIGRDPIGKEVLRVDGKADLKELPQFGYSTSLLVIPLVNIKLDYLGKYTFEFHFDGEFQAGLSMHVMQQPTQMGRAA